MFKINKKSKKESTDKVNHSIFNEYKLPNYLNQLLGYIEKKQDITYVTAVVHIKKNTFSFIIYSDVTYRNADGTIDIDMNALQSSILIDALPEHVIKIIETESEYSAGFTYEDLLQLFNNKSMKVESVLQLSDIISNLPKNVGKILIKDKFFYTTIEYYDNQNKMYLSKCVEYITGIEDENSPYPLNEIEISGFQH